MEIVERDPQQPDERQEKKPEMMSCHGITVPLLNPRIRETIS
jgi:hypothetical protein